MTTKKGPGSSAGSPYSIELDEALLEEALAAVEVRRPKAAPSAAAPSAVPTPDGGLEISLDLSVEGDTSDEAPTTEAGLDLAKMASEWERLVRELEAARQDRDLARRRLEAETKERTRLKMLAARTTAQVDELREGLIRAEEGRRTAETEVARLRDELRASTEGVARLRERMRRSEEEARQHGHGPVILSLLPVLENLERAGQHTDGTAASRVAEGLRMVVEQFRGALTRVGVQRIDASPGAAFQPAVHEAVTHTPTREQAPGTVLVELQPGYTLNGRLLRAARVAVAAPPARSSSLAEGEVLALSDESSDALDGVEVEQRTDSLDDSVSTSS